MSKQITITVSDSIYEQVAYKAEKSQRQLSVIIEEILTEGLAQFPTTAADRAMLREEESYQRLHPQLVEQFLGKNVAVHEGKMIDHDEDVVALLQRVRQALPNAVVLIRKVEHEADKVLRFRSPRLESL